MSCTVNEGDTVRQTKRNSDTMLIFFSRSCYCFLPGSVFPFSGFPLTMFPNISLAWLCVSVCVCVWSRGMECVVTHWCDQGHRGTSLSLSVSGSLALSFSAGSIPPALSDAHLHRTCELFESCHVWNQRRRNPTAKYILSLANCLTNSKNLLVLIYFSLFGSDSHRDFKEKNCFIYVTSLFFFFFAHGQGLINMGMSQWSHDREFVLRGNAITKLWPHLNHVWPQELMYFVPNSEQALRHRAIITHGAWRI